MIINARQSGRTENLILGIWFATLIGQTVMIAVPTKARANQIMARLRLYLTRRQLDRVKFNCGDDPPTNLKVHMTVFDDLAKMDL